MCDRGEWRVIMDILTGYEVSAGTVVNEKTGEVIPYDNRILYCVSDDVAQEFHGFIPFQQKVKTADLADWLNIPGSTTPSGVVNPLVVNKFLDGILQQPIKFRRGPNRKGEFVLTGISLAKKPSEA